jgi:hypothetical protein
MGTEDVSPEEWERTAVSGERGPDEEAAGAERRRRIAEVLESLSEHHRSIIILGDIEGLSYREIAEVLGVPMGTVMSRLHNARKRLRDALGPGFLALLLALLSAAPAHAQVPTPPPPPVPLPGPPPPTWTERQVCVYALIILASNPLGMPGTRLTPTPPLQPPGAAPLPGARAPSPGDEWTDPPAPQGGCGTQVRLRPWVPRLQEVFGYSTYEPMSAFETIMPLGMAQRFALPGGRALEIQPLAIRDPVVRLAVRIMRGSLAEIATVMDVPPRRPALIGGPPHGAGVLIIAIRSRIER